jgi:hypothetical protein
VNVHGTATLKQLENVETSLPSPIIGHHDICEGASKDVMLVFEKPKKKTGEFVDTRFTFLALPEV